jgi:diaminohydroxyphosphoribosylaminopyrimidine deaminase/5-amino-6-(5-phosphoribosylamino)uracil reductase
VTAFSELDEYYMQEALRLAEKGRGKTRPNPVVGAVITRNKQLIATGYHHRAGQAHAEIEALRQLDMRAPRRSTLYVTLEPCNHTGRTGPCTKSIIASGIERVVVGCRDENPLVHGRGITSLRRAGLLVDVGCLEDRCHDANAGFFTWISAHRPLVTLKAAATLDGYIGDGREQIRPPKTRWITGLKARAHAHQLRAQNDAILVGIGTILADNPRLTVRQPGRQERAPLRIVLDSRLRIPSNAACLRTPDLLAPLIVASERAMRDPLFSRRKKRVEAQGAEVIVLPADPQGCPRLADLMAILATRGIQRLLVEGGSTIHGAFMTQGLVDRIVLYLAPRLVGGGHPIARGLGPGWLQPLELGPLTMLPLGKDWVVLGQVQRHNQAKPSRQ